MRKDTDDLNIRRNAELDNQHALDARRSAVGASYIAGVGTVALPVETREAPKGDCDEVFKAALVDAPTRPFFKHEQPTERKIDHEIADNRTEQDARSLNLLKVAHSRGEIWQPFAESQTPVVAKLHAQVALDEEGEIFYEGGEPRIRISKAA